jgi:transposase-like protein
VIRFDGMRKRSRPRRGRAFWQEVAAKIEATGVPQRTMAAQLGLSPSTLEKWIARLRRERPAKAAASAVRLLPVRWTPSESMPTLASVEVQVGAHVLRFPPGTDPTYVAALAAALGASRC